ncbi:hypothetical protein [Cellulomonas xiejunii]|uniref:Mannose-6-phosphate isomerase n=1 Tax=Cellulomonas xiejunii TaxID=2968083 RepID=A0ABY5KPX6_9CELL|nr:hypothetical protein [Cellulomonas xiejunii]MCC2315930.1 hypothetical protein [Cellulomonas xiejunii]MCC2320947.1 hypothetical protein [Cellulomonas xiejunii]UUI71227.1 hypothetical protein NP048_15730 [Cellulomonas xiejunii]
MSTTAETTFDQPVVATASAVDRVLNKDGGILRFAPAWVPRAFCTPGRRLRLHPDDYYPFDKGRGGIDERWIASSIRADNGPRTGPYEALSLAVDEDGLVPFDEIIAAGGADVIGSRLWDRYGAWTAYTKFYDNLLPLPFHVHASDEKAALVGKVGKPEAYYYPPQMNNYLGEQPISYFGLRPDVTREQLAEHLRAHARGGDNRITDLAYGYRTRLGEGWDIPAGVLHAPGSVCTYEPQAASDVLSMFESWSNNAEVGSDLLWKDVPADRHGDHEFLVDLLDWELNADPDFRTNRALVPYETEHSAASGGRDFVEKWIVYRSTYFSAKELTVLPGRAVTLTEQDAYGLIAVQGHGTINGLELAAISLVRIDELTRDEYFVTAPAARAGVRIENRSDSEPLVVLKNYGPGNVELGI